MNCLSLLFLGIIRILIPLVPATQVLITSVFRCVSFNSQKAPSYRSTTFLENWPIISAVPLINNIKFSLK